MAGAEMEPMAVKLGRMGPTISLQIRNVPGSSWSCQMRGDFEYEPGKPIPPDAISCADHRAGGAAENGELVHMALGGFRSENLGAFDGHFWVGPISASPPLIKRNDADAS